MLLQTAPLSPASAFASPFMQKKTIVAEYITSSPYAAFDLHNRFFSDHPTAKREFAEVYRDTFNGIVEVAAKWTPTGSIDMIEFHLEHPGCNLALYDSDQARFVGGFLSTLVPKATGLCLSGQDIFMEQPLQGSGIGLDLYFRGLCFAQEIAKLGGQPIIDGYSTTYKNRRSPRAIWERSGCSIGPLFNLTRDEILKHALEKMARGVSVEAANHEETSQIASFIAHSSTLSSDGEKWALPQALAYVKFMLEQHPTTFIVAKKNNEIIAVSSIQIVPGRSGLSGVEPQCFVAKNIDPPSAIQPSFACMLKYSDIASRHTRKIPLATIEVPYLCESFFRQSFPEMAEDSEFVCAFGSMDKLTSYFGRLVRHRSRINLMKRKMAVPAINIA